jgi:CubicO group peptidase (beta-lactamase class C family)
VKIVKTAIGIFVALCAAPPSALAAPIHRLDGTTISPREVDATVKQLMQAAEVPGVGIAIINGDKVVFERAYGFRDDERKLPLTPDSVTTAASLTKSAFAYLVMQLAQEGRIGLDKPVYEYLPKPLPDYPQYADLNGDSRWKKISARMLLSHTSGLPNLRALEDDHRLRIHFEPGTHFAYSGEGMILLQLVVETVTQENLEQLMQEHVFRPLGMTRSSMVWQPRFDDDFTNGYDEYGRNLGPQRRDKPNAAGSMQTTLHDYALFVAAVMTGKGLGRNELREMLSPQIRIRTKQEFPSIENATTVTSANDPIRLSYGLGWGLYSTRYGEAFFKEGHDVGWRNYVVGFPSSKIGLVIMTNSANGEGIYKALLETLQHNRFTPIEWEAFTPYDKLPPRAPATVHHRAKVDAAELQKYLGKYGDPAHLPGVVLTIRQKGDHLSVQESVRGSSEAPQELFPESSVDFYSTNSDDSYSFVVGPSGAVKQLILHANPDIALFPLP